MHEGGDMVDEQRVDQTGAAFMAPMQEKPTTCFVSISDTNRLGDSAGQGLMVATAHCGASALSIHTRCGFS